MTTSEHKFVKRDYNSTARAFLEALCENPHHNLPNIVEVSEDFYVMEYIEGKTLQSMVEVRPLSSSGAKNFALQLLDAVEVLHRANIVHRDIKPENIIITDDGILKLIDFDIARQIVTSKNCDTQVLGTAGYAAPEQFGFTQTDQRSDIYAIGIVYNFMLTGKFPSEELAQGQKGKIITKCIHIDREKRYKNINRLRKDVRSGRFTSYGFFDIVPGFRTGRLWKMIFSSSVYLTALFTFFALPFVTVPGESFETAYSIFLFLGLWFIYLFCFFAVATNFMGVMDRINAPFRKRWKNQVFILSIMYIGAMVVSAIFTDSDAWVLNPINVIIYTYGCLIYDTIHNLIIGML